MASTPSSPGLSELEARRRLAQYAANELVRGKAASAWVVLAAQFKGAMIWLLLGAWALSAALGEVADAIAIGAIVVLNVLVGFFQEYWAEKSLMALRAPRARLRREGRAVMVAVGEVVPGDVLLLEGGAVVAADARLLEVHALRTVESALTGESVPVDKDVAPSDPDTPLAERHDYVFLGTAVAARRGVAEVTATGMATEMGRIASLLVRGPAQVDVLPQTADGALQDRFLLRTPVVVSEDQVYPRVARTERYA